MNTKTNYEVLFTENQISEKVKQLGLQITKDYENKNLLLVCMLKGSILFFSDLIRSIDLNFHIDFMAATSYVGTQSTGVVTIEKDLDLNISDYHILIVEDIIDTGRTLTCIKDLLLNKSPLSVKICTFLDKPSKRTVSLIPDYSGYKIDDLFVIGYGLDYDENYRNLPFIAIYKDWFESNYKFITGMI